jgi:hypothetical protein
MPNAAVPEVDAYIKALPPALTAVCSALRRTIERTIPIATARVWHGAPVWFLGEHPIVGTCLKAKKYISLLFWNGQAFEEPTLKAVGKFKAAEARFEQTAQIDERALVRQLKKAATMLWDYRGIVRKPKTPVTPDVKQAKKSSTTNTKAGKKSTATKSATTKAGKKSTATTPKANKLRAPVKNKTSRSAT